MPEYYLSESLPCEQVALTNMHLFYVDQWPFGCYSYSYGQFVVIVVGFFFSIVKTMLIVKI